MIFDEIVNEYGFDPFAPGPVTEPWQPWTITGALDLLLGPERVFTEAEMAQILAPDYPMVLNGHQEQTDVFTVVIDNGDSG